MKFVHVMAPASTTKGRSEHCGRPPLETEVLLNDCRPKRLIADSNRSREAQLSDVRVS
jgi:hypothetical protein